MTILNIRPLKANEIECRVQTVKENGCSLLLYKDARCDMRILDEVFGPMNWQRHHQLIGNKLFCTVSVYDSEKGQWIEKQDIGSESNMDAEKGQSSDSFKRACFNLGIGRELYTAPFIWIPLDSSEIFKQKNGNIGVKTKFKVTEIEYTEDREIEKVVIKDNKGNRRFPSQKPQNAQNQKKNKSKGSTSNQGKKEQYTCSDCSTSIKQAVQAYSEKHFGRALCMECQKKEKQAG